MFYHFLPQEFLGQDFNLGIIHFYIVFYSSSFKKEF